MTRAGQPAEFNCFISSDHMRIIKLSLAPRFIILSLFTVLASCTPDPINVPVGERIGALPLTVRTPIDNPSTPEKEQLGKLLFWDPILSGNMDVACASCHHPSKGWGDNIPVSIGVGGSGLGELRTGGVKVDRNAQTIINSAFNGIDVNGEYDPANTALFWDNRSISLEDQSLGPIHSQPEMRGDVYPEHLAIPVVSQRLREIAEYRSLFFQAFGDSLIDGDKIAKAIASYERTIISNNSPFDEYARGNTNAMTSLQVRGMNLFMDMNCTACHGGPMFSDYELHAIGVPLLEDAEIPSQEEIRTPTLRNLSFTGPYMHNGVFDNLREAVEFYDEMEENDEDAERLQFEDDPESITAIVAFLEALNDEGFDRSIPESVPSGLSVGGNIN